MSRSTAALALCAGLMAAEPVDASLAGLGDPPVECLALYALLALAAPPFAPDANARWPGSRMGQSFRPMAGRLPSTPPLRRKSGAAHPL